jgi:large subunit ribosomal protein L3
VIQIKTMENDGYEALQLGFIDKVEKRLNKPIKGHFAKSGGKGFRVLREARFGDTSKYKIGEEVKVGIFKAGDMVDVTGRSKGKGFQGVIKRHHFRGGPATHGSMMHRAPGSIGSNTYPGRTLKGKKLPGHMGDARVTVKNLNIVKVDEAKNLLLIDGAIPGAPNSIVMVRPAKSRQNAKI